MNNTSFIGRITNDLELKKVGDKTKLEFRLAVYRNKDHTDFIPCQAWDKTAEILNKSCKKGSMIGVNGSMQSSAYDDKDGVHRVSYVINVNTVDICTWAEKEEN